MCNFTIHTYLLDVRNAGNSKPNKWAGLGGGGDKTVYGTGTD